MSFSFLYSFNFGIDISGLCMQQFHELFAGDHFFFMQVLCDLIQLLTMFAQQRICLLMMLLYQIDDLLIDLCLCFGRAGETGIAAQISVVDGFQRNHVEVITLVICEKKQYTGQISEKRKRPR